MEIICAYCRRPMERLQLVESEVGEFVHEKTEYMCTNTRCEFSSRVIYRSRRPLVKNGYITVYMLQKKHEPKHGLRRLFGQVAALLAVRF